MTDDSPIPPPRYRSLREVPWRPTDLLLGLGPLVVARVLSEFDYRRVIAAAPVGVDRAISILFMAWILAFPLGMALYRGYRPSPPSARRVLIEGLVALPALLALWFVLYVGSIIWYMATEKVPTPGNPLQGPAETGAVGWVIFLGALAVFYAPISEELMFRGMAYNVLGKYLPRPAAAVIQALAFGFLHSYGWIHALAASVIGLALVILYDYRRTILAPVFLHTYQNAMAVAVAVAMAAAVANQPFLGVTGEPGERGCRVTHVGPGTAAEEAGLRVGDEIRTLDGYEIRDFTDLSNAIRSGGAERAVRIGYVRDGEARETLATLKRRGR